MDAGKALERGGWAVVVMRAWLCARRDDESKDCAI